MYRHPKCLGLALLLALVAVPARAVTLTVTTPIDEADGSCADGDCSLRDAAAAAAAGDTVEVPAGTYLLDHGQILIGRDLTIAGAGARTTLIDGRSLSRHFEIAAGTEVRLSGLTLQHGRANFAGAVYSRGSLTLDAVAVRDNVADFAGGLYGEGAALTIVGSAITGNTANGVGGVYSEDDLVRLENTTVSGNRANLLAGGLALFGAGAELRQVTIAGNTVTDTVHWQSGGLFLVAPAELAGVLLDDNSPLSCDPITTPTGDGNLDRDGSCAIAGAGNLTGVAAQLLPLTNNGGPTDTRALPAGSPAVDALAACAATIDQRGVARPQGAGCDIGAFELQSAALASTLCAGEDFTTGLGSLVYHGVGDADQGGAATAGGRLQLTSDGSALYHGSDNGGFVHRAVQGDFRLEVELRGFPVDQGGGYRRAGIAVRTGTGANDPRVFVEFLPQHPSYGQSALMFDYRGLDGIAKELGSTKLGLAAPLRLAIDRRGDNFTVWYSADGLSWVKPAGGAGGTVTIKMPAKVEVGMMQASYDSKITLTSEFDDFALCQPNAQPLPPLPPPALCEPGQPLDLVYLLDTSGSAPSAFPGFPSQLDAARYAIAQLNQGIAAELPGSRAALIRFQGGPAPFYSTGAGATVLQPLTASLAAVDGAAAAINSASIPASTSSPLTHGLRQAGELLATGASPAARPVVVLLGDGFVNVDQSGEGPISYRTNEMAAISLVSGLAYRTVGQTGWLGNWNGRPAAWDGEALADAMAQGLFLKERLPGLSLYSLGLHGAGPYRADLLGFLADYGAGGYHEASDAASLDAAVAAIFESLTCP